MPDSIVNVACVCVGKKYAPDYVYRLLKGVARHTTRAHRFMVYTDAPDNFPGLHTVRAPDNLPGWWAKMMLFDPSHRLGKTTIYLDLDNVPVGNLNPLFDLRVEFGICENFTRLAGFEWPCKFGSCVMTFAPDFGFDVWRQFCAGRDSFIQTCGHFGDQKAIEMLHPAATTLQDVLPTDFFLHYRKLTDIPRNNAALVIFGGAAKPHNTQWQWVRNEWAR